MRQPIYKMPPSKPLVKIEDLDQNIENIIDKKLKDIYSRLDKLEDLARINGDMWNTLNKSFSGTKIIIRKDLDKDLEKEK